MFVQYRRDLNTALMLALYDYVVVVVLVQDRSNKNTHMLMCFYQNIVVRLGNCSRGTDMNESGHKAVNLSSSYRTRRLLVGLAYWYM